MVKFKNWFDDRKRVTSNPGSKFVDVMQPVVQSDGSVELEVVGKHNLYDEIQSHARSVDINVILQRYANGDLSALSARVPMYLDLEGMPTNYMEVLNSVIAGEKFFSDLPADVKSKFDNNFYKFVSSIGSDEFKAAFGLKSSDVVEPVVSVEKEGVISE
ncbi:minor capsid protein [Alces alces faeces associated microvirus MP18 4940]|uniref:minor capsid protein n=1 Tax=Alces alces faeces associated microvirus MP18 4940 TaxID=2219137 RepID=UPI000DF076BC|nr:minor capsid protein [Alces alces faeces associated microvirus MP18 4940]AXB22584.1 minor capsid protein [Alces alces faeces associated microvirus MP18 4940]